MDIASTLKEVDTWPVEERLDLVQLVWDRIVDSGWQPTVSDDQRTEFDDRLHALDATPDDVESWESIVAHVRRNG